MRIVSEAAIERSHKLTEILGPEAATFLLAVEQSSQAGIRLLPDALGGDFLQFVSSRFGDQKGGLLTIPKKSGVPHEVESNGPAGQAQQDNSNPSQTTK
jgi:hypothetical protein